MIDFWEAHCKELSVGEIVKHPHAHFHNRLDQVEQELEALKAALVQVPPSEPPSRRESPISAYIVLLGFAAFCIGASTWMFTQRQYFMGVVGLVLAVLAYTTLMIHVITRGSP